MTTHPVPEIPEPPAAAVKATPVSARGRFGRWHLKAAGEGEEESWLLTYLDVMTLLLVMMVVMLAFAKPASEDAGQGDGSGGPAAPRAQAPLNLRPQLNQLVAPREKDPLAGLPLDQLGEGVEVLVNDGVVSFRISSEMLFPSGQADLIGPGAEMLATLVPALNAMPNQRIVVEGHTDDVPIQNARYPSNWELSSGRAGSVVRQLIALGVAPERIRATGFADTRPLQPNDSEANRAANRRVELVLETVTPAPK
jgi:chemotaxis protein MotB